MSANGNSVTQAILSRTSVRAFLPREVERSSVAEMLELAARAPSGGNLQPWRVGKFATFRGF